MQSVPITTNVVSLNPIHGMVYSTTFCDKVCLSLRTGQWFSPHTLVSSTNKIDCHDITQILLKVALNTIYQTKPYRHYGPHLYKVDSVSYHMLWYFREPLLVLMEMAAYFELPHLNYPYQNCFIIVSIKNCNLIQFLFTNMFSNKIVNFKKIIYTCILQTNNYLI